MPDIPPENGGMQSGQNAPLERRCQVLIFQGRHSVEWRLFVILVGVQVLRWPHVL
jgi:hypothetical protein